MKWMLGALVVVACDSTDCRSGNKCVTSPGGPPKIISAYVNDKKTLRPTINGVPCDGSDPRMWGGGFTVHDLNDPNMVYNVRCIPDLLANPPDSKIGDLGPFAYAVQFRIVFSTGLNGDAVVVPGTQMVASDVITTMSAAPMPVPINLGASATYYDPAGADFKQGIYGTAPPGPAIEVTPGENLSDGTPRVFGLPSGSATKICFDPSKLRDSAGNVLVGDNCVTVNIMPLSIYTSPGSEPCDGTNSMCDQITLADLVTAGVTFVFNAPMPRTEIANPAGAAPWLTITYQTWPGQSAVPLATDCYQVVPMGDPSDSTLPSADTMVAYANFPANPGCAQLQAIATLPASAYPITITVKAIAGMIHDQYGVQLPDDIVHQFQIRATP